MKGDITMRFALFFLLFLASPALAQEMCIDQCLPVPCKKSAADDCSKPKYTCTKRPCNEVYSQTGDGETAVAPVTSTGYYGAIAYDQKTGQTGFSGRAADQATAEQVALQQCRAAGCKLVASFANSCFAIAKNKDNSAIGWGVDGDKAQARIKARDMCITRSNEQSHTCEIREQRCYAEE